MTKCGSTGVAAAPAEDVGCAATPISVCVDGGMSISVGLTVSNVGVTSGRSCPREASGTGRIPSGSIVPESAQVIRSIPMKEEKGVRYRIGSIGKTALPSYLQRRLT
ncbi:hypothetical protein RRSWK_00379 [Rhodopirellula sp. SWK7]|nr:hypothetical protein RRSWK_00379 [Rhodopirellula sp. SWK7]